MTDDRVVSFPTAERPAAGEGDASVSPDRVTMGVEIPAERRLVLTVQTIAQLVTIARDEGVALDDGLAQGVERLAHRLRGAGLALPMHLEEALAEIGDTLGSSSEKEHDGPADILAFPTRGPDDRTGG